MRIKLSEQVADFVRRLPPEPRRKMKLALKALANGRGDLRPLEGPLKDYWRLRVGEYRVILYFAIETTVECIFAERRSIVYEVFAEALRERLSRGRE
jgi:mRNA-degrading endonuclease RelE of RelBE toxin-antitoxin system